MHLHAGAVQRDGFDLDAHDLLALQFLEHPVQHAGLGPAPHPRVDGVPVAKAFGQAAPLAAVLCDVQHRIDNLQVGHAHIAALQGQAVLDSGELLGCDLHAQEFRRVELSIQLVLTRPSPGDKEAVRSAAPE